MISGPERTISPLTSLQSGSRFDLRSAHRPHRAASAPSATVMRGRLSYQLPCLSYDSCGPWALQSDSASAKTFSQLFDLLGGQMVEANIEEVPWYEAQPERYGGYAFLVKRFVQLKKVMLVRARRPHARNAADA